VEAQDSRPPLTLLFYFLFLSLQGLQGTPPIAVKAATTTIAVKGQGRYPLRAEKGPSAHAALRAISCRAEGNESLAARRL